MKNKTFTVAELQQAINKRLEQYAGRKYEGTPYHEWYCAEIAAEFEDREITELEPTVWRIRALAAEGPVSLGYSSADDVAEVVVDAKRDRRIKRVPGRGVINAITVHFREDLLPLTLAEARRVLLEARRQEMIQNCTAAMEEARAVIQKAEADIAEIKAVVI